MSSIVRNAEKTAVAKRNMLEKAATGAVFENLESSMDSRNQGRFNIRIR